MSKVLPGVPFEFAPSELEVMEHALFRYMNWARVTDEQMLVAKSIRARVTEAMVRLKK